MMKYIFITIMITCFSGAAIAQAHTYNACCRYGKGNVMGDCICPACKKDKDEVNKALEAEAKREQDKASAKNVQKSPAIKKANDEAANNKQADNTVYIEMPKLNEKSTDEKEWEKEFKKYEIITDKKYNDPEEKAYTCTILYNKKVVFTSSRYCYIKPFANSPNLFLTIKPWDASNQQNNENPCTLINARGEQIKLGGYSAFASNAAVINGILQAYITTGCVPVTGKENIQSASKVIFVKLRINDLSTIIEKKDFLSDHWWDCNGH